MRLLPQSLLIPRHTDDVSLSWAMGSAGEMMSLQAALHQRQARELEAKWDNSEVCSISPPSDAQWD